MKKDEIISILSEEFNISEKQIKLVIDSFWQEVRKKLTNPLLGKGSILIHNFGKFYINKYAVKRYAQEIVNQDEFKHKNNIRSVEFYKSLAEILKRYERQTGKENYDE